MPTIFQKLLDPISAALLDILGALLILILAFIVANIARAIVTKGGKKLGLEKYTDKFGFKDAKGSLNFIGNIIFFIVFVLFIPGILDKLNMQGVSEPLMNMTTTLLGYLPNILAAVIIIIIGFFLARMLKNIVYTLLKRFNVDKLQAKVGIEVDENTMQLSSVIANFIYVLVLIPAFIAAFQALNISAISVPALNMLNMIINMIPLIFVAIVLIFIGVFIAKMAGNLLAGVLSSIGLDGFVKSLMGTTEEKVTNFSFSRLIGEVVRYIIIILFTVEAFNVVQLKVLQTVGTAIISYLPSLISSVIIIGVGILIGTWVQNLILSNTKGSKFTAVIVKYIIVVVAVFMMLSQLGLATYIVNTAFIMILGALAIAFAISFGIGGREFASRVLKKLYDKMENK